MTAASRPSHVQGSVARSVPSQQGADPELAMLTDLLAKQGLHTVYQPVVSSTPATSSATRR